MKNFASWGIRVRQDKDKNYYSVWNNLKTTRLELGESIPLEPDRSEFYDVGITERCNAMCPFCYVEADSSKKDYTDICTLWENWMKTFPEDRKLDFMHDRNLLDILSKPTKENTPEEIRFKVETVIGIKRNRGCYTEKPFQIAIGE